MRRVPAVLMLCAVLACASAHAERRQVGHVQGVPVFADQVQGASEKERAESVRGLFMAPIIRDYAMEHIEKFRITDAEASRMIERIEEFSACSGNGYELPKDAEQKRFVINFIGSGIKAQRLLHENFGGGRLLFQQAGVEAFDATHQLLRQSEAAGRFAITEPTLHALAYDYWTRDHGGFIIDDPAQIQDALDLDTVISSCPDAEGGPVDGD